MRRLLLSGTIICAVAATVLLPVQSASAYTDTEHLTIGLGQHKLIQKDAIAGVSVSFQASAQSNAYPADCDTDPVGCEVIPIDLDVPESDQDAIEAKAYLLAIVLRWDSGEQVDNVPEVGTQRQNDLEGYLFQDPNIRSSSGGATYTAWTHGNNPGAMTAVSPTSKKFNLVVANFSGVNKGFSLEVSLIKADDVKFEPKKYARDAVPNDVAPTYTPPAGTPQQNGFGGANLPPMDPIVTGGSQAPSVEGGESLVVPNIANGSPDSTLLAMGKVVRATGLGRHSVTVDSTIAQTAKVDKGTTKVVVTLLVLPILAVIAGAFLLFRRRQAALPAS